jgi:hypothetical protein
VHAYVLETAHVKPVHGFPLLTDAAMIFDNRLPTGQYPKVTYGTSLATLSFAQFAFYSDLGAVAPHLVTPGAMPRTKVITCASITLC